MNRISVLFAAGALGAAALTAGCSSTASKSAGAGSTPTSSSPTSSASTSAPSANPNTATESTTSPSTNPSTSASSATTAPPSAPTHAPGSPCTTTEMPSGTWRNVPDSEGAGHVAADIAFQNTSNHTCTITGFPAVSLLASNDHPLPTNVLKDDATAATKITIAPGAWAHTEMRYSPNVPGPGEPDSGQCEPMTVHALAQLPGDTAWAHVTLDNPTTVCEKGQLQAKAFVSGQASPTGG